MNRAKTCPSPGRHISRHISHLVGRLVVVSTVLAVGAAAGFADASGIGDALGAAFSPVQPCRLLDTRTGDTRPITVDGSASVWRVQVAQRCGTPAEIAAAALSVTATRARADGHLSVQPAGTPAAETSNLNYRPGRTVANTVVVAPSDGGAVDVHASTDVDIVIDVNGVFVDTDQPVAAGRLVPVAPRRLVDTRTDRDAASSGVTGHGAGDLRIDLDGIVPDDAVAVAVTVTAANGAPGFLTAHPAGTSRPHASILNLDAVNPTRATAVFVPVSDQGLTVHRSAPAHLVVDLSGYFTGPSADVSADGLFVAETPFRVWDSRLDSDPLHPGGHLTRDVAPAEAAVAALNVTAVAATGAGHLAIDAAGQPKPESSSLNYRWTEPIAAAALARNSTDGITFWSHAGTHVVVDRFGWFTGGAIDAVAPADRNPMPSAGGRILFVSDSSFAGIRWNGALGWLQGADFDSRLESCRRLIGASCRGREGYAPRTALAEVQRVAPGSIDALVIATGYNDAASRFPDALAQIIAAARVAGIDRVVWITYREPVNYSSPSHVSNAATFAANNRFLSAALASGAWPELRLLDWNAHTAGTTGWLTSDGVHFTIDGAREAALFISRALAHNDRRPCGAIGGHTDPGGWCADPTGRR